MTLITLRYMVRFSEVAQRAEEDREVPATTFTELVDHLETLYPGFRTMLYNKGGERHVAVLRRNGQKTRPALADDVIMPGDRYGFY